MRRFGGSLLIALTLGMAALVAQSGGSRSSSAKPYTTWTAYQGGSHSSQYSALDQINKSNVSQLEVAWTYPVTGTVIFNPIVVDDVMYVQGTGNAIVGARCGDRQGDLAPRQSRGDRRARAQLLGEPGSVRSAAPVSQRRQPDGHQRADRRDDHVVRQQRPGGPASGAVARGARTRCRRATRAASSRT